MAKYKHPARVFLIRGRWSPDAPMTWSQYMPGMNCLHGIPHTIPDNSWGIDVFHVLRTEEHLRCMKHKIIHEGLIGAYTTPEQIAWIKGRMDAFQMGDDLLQVLNYRNRDEQHPDKVHSCITSMYINFDTAPVDFIDACRCVNFDNGHPLNLSDEARPRYLASFENKKEALQ